MFSSDGTLISASAAPYCGARTEPGKMENVTYRTIHSQNQRGRKVSPGKKSSHRTREGEKYGKEKSRPKGPERTKSIAKKGPPTGQRRVKSMAKKKTAKRTREDQKYRQERSSYRTREGERYGKEKKSAKEREWMNSVAETEVLPKHQRG